MGYLNNVTSYRDDLLVNRVIIKHGNFVLLTPDGLVKNTIPGSENCDITILPAPELGASFIDYLMTLHQSGGNQSGFNGEGTETLVYTISGEIEAEAEGKVFVLAQGGYLYCLPGELLIPSNTQTEDGQLFLYKRHYTSATGHSSWLASGNANQLGRIHYKSMDDVVLLDFLPKELGSNINMRVLSFEPGANHGYVETYVQGYGAYILSGQGVYNLDNQWISVKKGDYVFTDAYSLQAGYGVGRGEAFSYIYPKDCNRDIEI